MIEYAEATTIASEVLDDFRAAQAFCRRTGHSKVRVLRDGTGRRTVVTWGLTSADRERRLKDITKEINADRERHLAAIERDLPANVRRRLRLARLEREVGLA